MGKGDIQKAAVLIACLLALTGCDQRRQQVESAIRAQLKDPESAMFGEDFSVYGPRENILACGTVNARNSYGGYVGETPYMVWAGKIYIGTDETSLAIMNCCALVMEESKNLPPAGLSEGTVRVCSHRGDGNPITI